MAIVHLEPNEDLLTLLCRREPSTEVAARESMDMALYRRGVFSRGDSADHLAVPLFEFLPRVIVPGIPYVYDIYEE